jgi:hypothetical protein
LKSVELFNLKLYDQTTENLETLLENKENLLKIVPLFSKIFKKEKSVFSKFVSPLESNYSTKFDYWN